VARVFLADPALKTLQGHHFNLSLRLLEVLVTHGHRVVCLANKKFGGFDAASFEHLPEQAVSNIGDTEFCFSEDTYDTHRAGHANAQQKVDEHAQTLLPVDASQLAPPKRWLLNLYRVLPNSYRSELTPRLRSTLGWLRAALTKPVPDKESSGEGAQDVSAGPRSPAQELLDALHKRGATADDYVLFHTCDAQTYRDVFDVFCKHAPLSRWGELPSFHLVTPYDQSVMPHNKREPTLGCTVGRLQRLGLLETKIRLYAENDVLATHLSEELETSVSVLAIPATNDRSEKRASEQLRIAYLGPARTEKGFTKLPQLVEEARSLKLGVQFTIQVTPQILGYTADVKVAVDALRSLVDPSGPTSLRLIDSPLNPVDYAREISAQDALLLHYDPERYGVRSSGIAVEGIVCENTLIATSGTFPAHIGGDSAISVGYDESALAAIEELLQRRDDYARRASERRQWYLNTHSSSVYLETLLRPVSNATWSGAESVHSVEKVQWLNLVGPNYIL